MAGKNAGRRLSHDLLRTYVRIIPEMKIGRLKEGAFSGSLASPAFTTCWACRSTPTTERKRSGPPTSRILNGFTTSREPFQHVHDRSRACKPRVLVPDSASAAHSNSQPQSTNPAEGVPVRAVIPEINRNPVPRPRLSQDSCDGSPFVPRTGWPDLQHSLAADEPAKHNSDRGRECRSVRTQDDRSERPVIIQ